MTLPTAFLDELRARTLLSGVISRTVPLKKAGREFRACCPFHNEKSPSFFVNDDKGFYHCFGCGAHGDVIRWMTDQRGMEFLDAVRELADAAGLDMPARDARTDQREAEMDRAREVMARAAAFFAQCLIPQRVEELLARGVTAEQQQTFGIGFAPTAPRGQKSALESRLGDVAVERLKDVGLMKINDAGEFYPFFRNRIMIPIHDARGRVIAFGGRAIGDAQPKYLNSPDTPLFDKGRTLFNHHRAAPAARKNGRLVIVEGYMDVMAMARAGVVETVAPNGTALTPAQLALAWRMASVPICCFDGDRAGQAAAVRAAKTALPALEPGKSLAFAFPPADLDPDDLLRERGAGAISEMLAAPRQLVDVLWEHELAATAPLASSPDARADLLGRLERLAKEIKHHALALEYWSEFRRLFQEQTRRAQRGGRQAPKDARPGVGLSSALEAGLIVGLLRHPALAQRDIEHVSALRWSSEGAIALVDMLVTAAISGDLARVEVPVLLERAGLADIARRAESAAQVPFSFVRGAVSAETEAELADALSRMPRKASTRSGTERMAP